MILLSWRVSSARRSMSESDVALYLVDAQTVLSQQSVLSDGTVTEPTTNDNSALEAFALELVGTKRSSDLFVINKIDQLKDSEQAAIREGVGGRTDVVVTSLTEDSA